MAHQIQEADTVPIPSPSTPQPAPADILQNERDHLQVLRRRLGAAAEALARIHDQLQARASRCHGGDEVGHLDPDGGRQ